MSLQVADSLQTGTIDTPLDARTRINAISDIPNIELPYAGLIFYCVETGKHYKVTSIKSKQIGPIVQENAQIDEYETLPDEESLTEGFAPKDHTHQLSDLTGASDLPNTYAAKEHNHAETYAAKEHDHAESYADKEHRHDNSYAAKEHDHSETYAAKEHAHDENYAAKEHDHNGDYAPLVDGKIPSQYQNSQASAHVVADIAARDQLTSQIEGERAFVRDATADETVNSGAAEYIWDGSAWFKIAEAESLDLILDWSNVQKIPSEFPPSEHEHEEYAQVQSLADLAKKISALTPIAEGGQGFYPALALGTEPSSYNRIRYVRQNGSGTKDGSSWDNAMASVSEAMTASTNGDLVYIMEGQYYASGTITLSPGIKIYGGFDEENPDWEHRSPFSHPSVINGAGTVMISGSVDGLQTIDGVTFDAIRHISCDTLKNSVIKNCGSLSTQAEGYFIKVKYFSNCLLRNCFWYGSVGEDSQSGTTCMIRASKISDSVILNTSLRNYNGNAYTYMFDADICYNVLFAYCGYEDNRSGFLSYTTAQDDQSGFVTFVNCKDYKQEYSSANLRNSIYYNHQFESNNPVTFWVDNNREKHTVSDLLEIKFHNTGTIVSNGAVAGLDDTFDWSKFGDFRISEDSCLIGKGTYSGVVCTDLDGKNRPLTPSVGAYEASSVSGNGGGGGIITYQAKPATISLPVPYDQNNNNVSLYIDIGLDPEFTEGSYTRIRMTDHYAKMKVFSNEQFHTLTEGSLGVPYYGATVSFTLDNEMMPDYSAGKTYYARYTWMDSLGASDDWKGFIFTGDIADMEPIHTEYETPPTVKEITEATGTLTLDYLNGEIQNYTMSSDVTVNLSEVANVPFGEALICNIKRTGGTLTVVNGSSRQTYTETKTYMVVITNFGTPLIAVTETIWIVSKVI